MQLPHFHFLPKFSDLDLVLVIDFAMDLVAIDWFLAFDTFARVFAADVVSDVVLLDLALTKVKTTKGYGAFRASYFSFIA